MRIVMFAAIMSVVLVVLASAYLKAVAPDLEEYITQQAGLGAKQMGLGLFLGAIAVLVLIFLRNGIGIGLGLLFLISSFVFLGLGWHHLHNATNAFPFK